MTRLFQLLVMASLLSACATRDFLRHAPTVNPGMHAKEVFQRMGRPKYIYRAHELKDAQPGDEAAHYFNAYSECLVLLRNAVVTEPPSCRVNQQAYGAHEANESANAAANTAAWGALLNGVGSMRRQPTSCQSNQIGGTVYTNCQ